MRLNEVCEAHKIESESVKRIGGWPVKVLETPPYFEMRSAVYYLRWLRVYRANRPPKVTLLSCVLSHFLFRWNAMKVVAPVFLLASSWLIVFEIILIIHLNIIIRDTQIYRNTGSKFRGYLRQISKNTNFDIFFLRKMKY